MHEQSNSAGFLVMKYTFFFLSADSHCHLFLDPHAKFLKLPKFLI